MFVKTAPLQTDKLDRSAKNLVERSYPSIDEAVDQAAAMSLYTRAFNKITYGRIGSYDPTRDVRCLINAAGIDDRLVSDSSDQLFKRAKLQLTALQIKDVFMRKTQTPAHAARSQALADIAAATQTLKIGIR